MDEGDSKKDLEALKEKTLVKIMFLLVLVNFNILLEDFTHPY
jgi:hypothetical protein